MSADNQIVIIKYMGKYYVNHILGGFNEITILDKFDLSDPLDSVGEAFDKARKLKEETGYVEYGISPVHEIPMAK